MTVGTRKRALQTILLVVIALVFALVSFNVKDRIVTKSDGEVVTFERSQVEIKVNISYSGFGSSTSITPCSGTGPFRGIRGSTVQFYDADRLMIYESRLPSATEKDGQTCTYLISVDKLPGLEAGNSFYRVIFPFGQTEIEPVDLEGDEELSATIALPLD